MRAHLSRSAEKDCSELLKAKNQLALDLESLLSHKEVVALTMFSFDLVKNIITITVHFYSTSLLF